MTLPKPEGIQLEVLDLPPKGHVVILGTAGSGKTTLAIYRALFLDRLNRGKVLLLTFNTTLVKYLEAIAGEQIANIDVRNYHKFARGYLKSRGKMPGFNNIVSGIDEGENRKLKIVRDSIINVQKRVGMNSTLKRDEEVFLEEINWIQKMGLRTLEEYEDAERIGRYGTRIIRENRKYFYMILEEYRKLRTEEGYLYDWEDIAMAVYNELVSDANSRMYSHIIIDEGQDLSPIMLKSLTKAIPNEGSLTFFGDVAQQIYGSRISWHDAGLKIEKNKIWRFNRNYRNSKEIAQLAIAISESEYFTSETDIVEPVMPTASSPLPALVKFKSEKEEKDWLKENIGKTPRNQQIAILVRNREQVDAMETLVRGIGIRPQILKKKMSKLNCNALISIGTYHSAKGLEFDTVFLPYCSKRNLPGEDRIKALESREEALVEEIKLLYVAVTRAKRGLIISYTGEKTELLPNNQKNGLYLERDF